MKIDGRMRREIPRDPLPGGSADYSPPAGRLTARDISPHVEKYGGLANIYPSHYERELGVALQAAQHEIEVLNRSILIQNEQHIIDLGKIDRLRAQVREFRQKCDPSEDHVLVTAEEIE